MPDFVEPELSLKTKILICKTQRQFETQLIFARRPKDLTKQTPNGLRYLRVGGRGQNSENRILFGRGKCSKMAQNPTRQVHALLGVFVPTRTLAKNEDVNPKN